MAAKHVVPEELSRIFGPRGFYFLQGSPYSGPYDDYKKDWLKVRVMRGGVEHGSITYEVVEPKVPSRILGFKAWLNGDLIETERRIAGRPIFYRPAPKAELVFVSLKTHDGPDHDIWWEILSLWKRGWLPNMRSVRALALGARNRKMYQIQAWRDEHPKPGRKRIQGPALEGIIRGLLKV